MKTTRIGISAALAIGLLAGGAIGVTAQRGSGAPVEFTGVTRFGPCPGPQEIERALNVSMTRGGYYCTPGIVEPFSDPRLHGDIYIWPWIDRHDDGPTIFATGFTIINEDGAWRGVPDVYLQEESSGDHILIGEGAYEGLTVIATVDLDSGTWDWHGWIIDGPVTPFPTEPDAIR